jgi:hypothetical protein
MATTQYSIRVVKTFPYRGDPVKQFSNRYYFDGGAPADSTAWHDLMDAVVAAEKAIYLSAVHIVDAFGYGPTSDVAVASKSYTQAGTLTASGASNTPGDCASVLRMATTKMSVKNHPVYVFSYFHEALYLGSSSDADTLHASQKTAIETYGSAWLAGITVGARTYKRTTPDGHATTGRFVDGFITHRDFPR